MLTRPAGLFLALLGTKLPWPEFWTAAWFGPKGFAPVLYSILVFETGVPDSEQIFRLSAIVIGASIVAHSSTDVPVAKWFQARVQEEDVGTQERRST